MSGDVAIVVLCVCAGFVFVLFFFVLFFFF